VRSRCMKLPAEWCVWYFVPVVVCKANASRVITVLTYRMVKVFFKRV
jgi:hypothetical protein